MAKGRFITLDGVEGSGKTTHGAIPPATPSEPTRVAPSTDVVTLLAGVLTLRRNYPRESNLSRVLRCVCSTRVAAGRSWLLWCWPKIFAQHVREKLRVAAIGRVRNCNLDRYSLPIPGPPPSQVYGRWLRIAVVWANCISAERLGRA